MKWNWFSIAVLMAVAGVFTSFSGCGHNQHLSSITVQPSGAEFGGVDPNLVVNFKAFGAYIHPPQTKDITAQVTWTSDTPEVAEVTGGVVHPNTNCGTANVTATFDDGGNLVISNGARITVDGPASQGCPQGGGTFNLSVSVTSGAANGVISSSPAGIDCGSTCGAAFAAGSSVTLTPAPLSGHSFGGWGIGCSAITGTVCSVILNSDVTVSASFN